jgi:hypothetical protein
MGLPCPCPMKSSGQDESSRFRGIVNLSGLGYGFGCARRFEGEPVGLARKGPITMFGPRQVVPEGPYLVRVARLRAAMDPFHEGFWGAGPLAQADVASAIAEGRLATTPNEAGTGRHSEAYRDRPESYDAERVAYLVVTPAPDAICVEVTSQWGDIDFLNGGHRLAAAIYRRDLWISTSFGGYVDPFHDRFPEALRPPKLPTRVYGGAARRWRKPRRAMVLARKGTRWPKGTEAFRWLRGTA